MRLSAPGCCGAGFTERTDMRVIAIITLTITHMITIIFTATTTITGRVATRTYLKVTSPGAAWLPLPLAAG